MIDFIKIVAPINPYRHFGISEQFEWKGLTFSPVFKKSLLIGYESDYNGLRVMRYYNRIEVCNSLHKFYKGNNYTDFCYSEIKERINILCNKFGIVAKNWEIKKLEFGLNLITSNPAYQYLSRFLEYKGREFEKMRDNQIVYGRKCYMSEYALKVYDKHIQTKMKDKISIPENTLRVEFYYKQYRKLPKSIHYLSDLLYEERFKDLYKDLKEAIENIIYDDEYDFKNSTNEERMLFFASQNTEFLKVENQINKAEVKTIKKKIKQLKERFLKKDFRNNLSKLLNDKYINLYCS